MGVLRFWCSGDWGGFALGENRSPGLESIWCMVVSFFPYFS